ncbi:MAG TPA: hypothetical protein VMG08_20570 [Allosphingosinicella sp.]|nr:hypothetical protein [Allosphingosinicella sp.]
MDVDPIARTGLRKRRLRRALPVLPALLMLAAAPVAAAMPSLHLVSLCTAEGPRLALLEGPDPAQPPDGGPDQAGCAHALCPRGLAADRKARGRS